MSAFKFKWIKFCWLDILEIWLKLLLDTEGANLLTDFPSIRVSTSVYNRIFT